MARDSLGKKTHLPCVLYLFRNNKRIWVPKKVEDLGAAIDLLKDNSGVTSAFDANSWPSDPRAWQAYVHRFFEWLELPDDEYRYHPTVILANEDSIALRQCLWLDFVFGTPEAERAIWGIWEELDENPEEPVEISPDTHERFCDWLEISPEDNTRRGPFARWLEDAGLGIPKPTRGARRTDVLVDRTDQDIVACEALIYGLVREFGALAPSGYDRTVTVPTEEVVESTTAKALFLRGEAVPQLLSEAVARGYVKKKSPEVEIDRAEFARSLRLQRPFPSQSWIDEDSSLDDPLDRDCVSELKDFPDDECFAEEGSPFEGEADAEGEAIKRRRRDQAFRERVAAAYDYHCCVSGLHFRSPDGQRWYGDCAHIVPHQGKDREGKEVYGTSAIANGLFLSKFEHWCFDRGWWTLEPMRKKGRLVGYQVRISALAVDEFFEDEAEHLLERDKTKISTDRLPENEKHWPSVSALEWHRENVLVDLE